MIKDLQWIPVILVWRYVPETKDSWKIKKKKKKISLVVSSFKC